MRDLEGDHTPRLGRGVRLRVDRVRRATLLLRPEQGFELRGSALEVVRLCDGRRTVNEIVAALQAACAGPGGATDGDGSAGTPRRPDPEREVPGVGGALAATISDDVRRLLRELAARRLIELD